jgi:hypothetical protein
MRMRPRLGLQKYAFGSEAVHPRYRYVDGA